MKNLLRCAAALLVAGCGTTDPNHLEDTLMAGSVSFDFIGAGSSTSRRFNATGSISATEPEGGTTPVAAAQLMTNRPFQTLVLGAIPQTDTLWNQALLRVNRVAVGSSTFKTACFGIDCRADSSAVQKSITSEYTRWNAWAS